MRIGSVKVCVFLCIFSPLCLLVMCLLCVLATGAVCHFKGFISLRFRFLLFSACHERAEGEGR